MVTSSIGVRGGGQGGGNCPPKFGQNSGGNLGKAIRRKLCVKFRANQPLCPVACRGGGGRGAWPPGASLGGGARPACRAYSCKKKIRPRQISKVTSLQSAVADAGFTKRGRGALRAHPEPRRRQPCRPMRQGGGGGRRCNHWPPGAGDPRYTPLPLPPLTE